MAVRSRVTSEPRQRRYPRRDVRQRDLVPPARLASLSAAVIGVGAVGRQVALQLASVGVSELVLIDFDTVSEENLANQGFSPDELGKHKSTAVATSCRRQFPQGRLVEYRTPFNFEAQLGSRWTDATRENQAIFLCVDSIAVRKEIFEAVRGQAGLIVDGRMLGELGYVYSVVDARGAAQYAKTLFAAGEAEAGRCASKSTIYCSNVVAGMMVAQMASWLRGGQTFFSQSIHLGFGSYEIQDHAPVDLSSQ